MYQTEWNKEQLPHLKRFFLIRQRICSYKMVGAIWQPFRGHSQMLGLFNTLYTFVQQALGKTECKTCHSSLPLPLLSSATSKKGIKHLGNQLKSAFQMHNAS